MSAEKAARYIGTPQEKAARALARDSSKPWSESDAEEDYDRQPPSVPHSLPKKKKAAASSERNRQHEQQHVGLKKKASFDDVESSPVSSDVEIIEPSKSTTSCSTAQNSKTSAQPEFYSNAAPPSRSPSPVFARARLPTFRKDASTSAPPKIQQRNDTLQPSPLVNGSHHPESTSHSPPVSSFAPPGQDKPTFEVIWVDQSKNKSSKHMIRILATDAQEPDIPPLTNREDLPRFGHISATIALGYETDTHKRWRKELGGELADFLNLDALVGRNQWELEDFPRGYQLVERLEGPAGRPTRTTMLYGSMFANPFLDSKRELLKHLMGLINGGEPCSCQNCATRVETKGAAIVLSPPPEVVPPASKSTVLGEINGPMQKLALQLELRKQGFSWSADKGFHRVENDAPASSKDPAKVNADNAELLKLKRRATAYGGPYVDPHQSEDIERANQNPSSWVRMKELVWYTLPTPIRSRNHSLGGPLFTHWPAVVCERKTLSEPRLVGPVPPMGQPMTSESIQSHQTMEWHVCLLGCSDFRWSTTNGLLPFLAYKPHTESLFQIAPDATSYRRSWNDHDGRPAWPSIASFTDAETAYIAFAIALSHASSIMKKLVLCDPFAHRVRDPDLPESALSAGKHNESIRNWAAPRVAHFQGAFIGAEKIWVGDLIRLRVYKSSKTFLPGEGEQLEPNFFADSAGRDRAKNALASKHKKTSSPNASYLERRCLVVLVSSIWRNPSNDKPFISGYVYEMKKLIHQEKPQHPPSPPDLPPLPTPPPGYCFRLLVPLPAEYSFDMELLVQSQ